MGQDNKYPDSRLIADLCREGADKAAEAASAAEAPAAE